MWGCVAGGVLQGVLGIYECVCFVCVFAKLRVRSCMSCVYLRLRCGWSSAWPSCLRFVCLYMRGGVAGGALGSLFGICACV